MRRALVSLAALALALVAPGGPARADRREGGAFELSEVEKLELDDAEAGVGPDRAIELYVRAQTRLGAPVEHLRPVDLQILEDGRPVDPKRVTLTPLGDSDRGIAVVLAIDVSRTMMGEPLDEAKAAAMSFLDRLGPNDKAAVVTFAGKVDVIAPFTLSKADARQRVSTLVVDSSTGGTTVYDGMHRAVELLRQTEGLPRRAFAIVLSDGRDGGSQRSLEDVIQLAQGDGSRPRILVFAIGYATFGRSGLAAMQRLAKETGADFVEAAGGGQLGTFYDAILAQMTKSYLARFRSTLDGKTHRVEISAGGVKQARSLLYPPPSPVPFWPYAAGGVGGVLGLGLVTWLVLRSRPAGRLVFVAGARAGESVPLRRGRVRIGSLPDNDVAIPSGTVSRYHAEIHVNGRRVSIEDLRSSNGTQVNGTPIQTSPLRPGDRIRIADVDLVFER